MTQYYKDCLTRYIVSVRQVTNFNIELTAIETKIEHIKGGIVKRPEGKADDCMFHELVEQKDAIVWLINQYAQRIHTANEIFHFAKGNARQILVKRYKENRSVMDICNEFGIKRAQYYHIIDNVLCMYRIAKGKEK